MPVFDRVAAEVGDHRLDLGDDERRPAPRAQPVTATVFCAVSAVMAEVP